MSRWSRWQPTGQLQRSPCAERRIDLNQAARIRAGRAAAAQKSAPRIGYTAPRRPPGADPLFFFGWLYSIVWAFFYKLGSPRWFYQMTTPWLPWLALLSGALLLYGGIWGLAFAPPDFRQGNSYRIIFIHVPSSFVALAGYYLMAIAGGVSLIWKIKVADMVLRSCAGVGAAMTFMALVTGAIWGKPTWGTWWVWDARVTSMLVLLFLYLGVLALYRAFEDRDIAAKACAVLSLVGTVNIPIIYKSVDWWFSLHQPASIRLSGAPSMHADMWQPLAVMVAGFYCFFALAVILRLRSEILEREEKARWVEEMVVTAQA